MKEIWKDVKGYEGRYKASSLGRIKSLKYGVFGPDYGKEKILNPVKMKKGYMRVSFKDRKILVHRLVAEAFGIIKNHSYKKPVQINHIDGDKTNNKIDNLEACNQSDNMKHAFKIGLKKPFRGESNGHSVYKEETIKKIIVMSRAGFKRKQIQICLGLKKSIVRDVLSKKSWAHLNHG